MNGPGLTLRELTERVWLLDSGLNAIHTALLWPGLPPAIPLVAQMPSTVPMGYRLPCCHVPEILGEHAPKCKGEPLDLLAVSRLHANLEMFRRDLREAFQLNQGTPVNLPVPAEGFGLSGFGGKTLREQVADNPEASAALAELDDMGL